MPASSSRVARRAVPGVVGLALLATGLGAAAQPSAGATAAAPDPVTVSLKAPHRQVVHSSSGRVYGDLGVRLVPQGGPLEVRSTRTSYDQPIRAVARLGGTDRSLPGALVPDFTGLHGSLIYRIQRVDQHGQPVGGARSVRRDGCLGETAERVTPDAPPTSPYPTYCAYNPYALGSVQGVQEGWAASVARPYGRMMIGVGRFDVTARLRGGLASALGMDAGAASVTTRVIVRKNGGDDSFRRSRTSSPKPAAHRPSGPQTRAADVEGPTPDLRSLPAWGIRLTHGGDQLAFSATVWNGGESPLVVDGFRRADEDVMDGYQYFFDTDGNQVGYTKVGDFEWDAKPTHQHWHFEDFATYTLLRADKSRIAKSRKEAFCLANTDAVDFTVPGAEWNTERDDLSTVCGERDSLSIREVLASGWGDTYAQFRAGQSFDVSGLPDGVYFVEVKANPRGVLVESDETNNVSYRRIKLVTRHGERRVVVPQVGLVDEDQGEYYY